MDAGAGTFAALQNQIDPGAVDGIVLSHAHGDHCLDIFGYYYSQRFGRGDPSRVPVYVPEGLLDRLLAFLGPGDHDIAGSLDFRVVKKGSRGQIGPLGLEFSTTAHPVPTLCVRIEAGERSLTYSADTGPGGGLSALAEGTDLLLCEATYQGASEAKPWPHHLTAGEAGSIARSTASSKQRKHSGGRWRWRYPA
jgi:ribonuclease BN (tRNA processing enzyme)